MPRSTRSGSRASQVLDLDRMHAAFDDGQLIGGGGCVHVRLHGARWLAAVRRRAVVGVYPTHRRRGALRGMMDTQLRDVHERGEPIAALWASEETIYGRFGYGLAAWCGEMTLHGSGPRSRSRSSVAVDELRRRGGGGHRAVPARCGTHCGVTGRASRRGRRRGGEAADAAHPGPGEGQS